MNFHSEAGIHKAFCKVSVVMSVFNGEKYLAQAVESILGQIYTDFEFIIIDDGSTDNTLEILRSYHDPRIIIVSQENRGLTRSLNRAISIARGEYVARMDADDLSHPRRFDAQVAELDANPKIDLVGCFYEIIDFQGRASKVVRLQTDPVYRLWRLQFHSIYAHGSVMMRRSKLMKVGGYNNTFTCAQDYDLWLRLTHASNTRVLPSVLYSFRVSQGHSQISTQHGTTQAELALAISNQALSECNPSLTQGNFQNLRYLYLGPCDNHFGYRGMSVISDTVNGFCGKYGISQHDQWYLIARVVRDTLLVLLRKITIRSLLCDVRLICKLFAMFPAHLVYGVIGAMPILLERLLSSKTFTSGDI